MRHSKGFTIVELLIVIVVIGILAAIILVAYNGVQDRAHSSALDSNLVATSRQIELSNADNSAYPASLAGLTLDSSLTYNYRTIDPHAYCVDVTDNLGNTKFRTSTGKKALPGPCPVGYWGLDGSANDASGNDTTGVLSNVTTAADRHGTPGGAYSFNGSTSKISINTPPSVLSPSTAISVAAWVYPTAYTNSIHGIVNYGNGGYWLELSATGQPQFYVSTTVTAGSTIGGSNPLQLNAWSLVTGTYTDGQQRVYLNGDLVASSVKTGTVTDYTTGIFYIGTIKNQAARSFIGSIDDVSVYDKALSQSEVTSLYKLGK